MLFRVFEVIILKCLNIVFLATVLGVAVSADGKYIASCSKVS